MTANRTSIKIQFLNTEPSAHTDLITALTETAHKFNTDLTVKGLTAKGAPKVNPEGDTVLSFTDINKTITLPNPKAARKWLRKHSHSVTTCRKEGNNWIFLKASEAVKLYFKTH